MVPAYPGGVFVAGDAKNGMEGNAGLGLADAFVTKYNSSGTKQ